MAMNAHATDSGADPAQTSGKDQPHGDKDSKSPGRRLRHAREARRLDANRIAGELRLSPETVAAIERDDYEHLPSPVFVGGYIRSYARLVGLDPEPLLHEFRRLHPAAEPPPRVATARRGDPGEGAGWLLPLLGILAVGGLIGGGVWWWMNRPPLPEPTVAMAPRPQQPDAMGRAEPPPTPAPIARPEPAETAQSAIAEPAPAEDESAAAQASPPRPLPVPPVPELPPGPAADTGTAASDGELADAGASDVPAAAPDAAAPETGDAGTAEAGAGATSPVPAAGAEDEVVIAFTGPCWVDIRDATGDFKLFGEMADGDREVLGGEPPYSLILGNAQAVDMQIGGQPFDVAAIAKGNVARFTLDAAAFAAAARPGSAEAPSTPD